MLDPGNEKVVMEERRTYRSKMRISHRIEQVWNQKHKQRVYRVGHSSTLQRGSVTRASDGQMCIQNAQPYHEE
jgi:hypothetical protein